MINASISLFDKLKGAAFTPMLSRYFQYIARNPITTSDFAQRSRTLKCLSALWKRMKITFLS